MRIFAIANQKGGCGKTTTAINLAAALSRSGWKTLLVDLDPQAHASLGLNFENRDSIYNVISKLTPRRMDINDIIRPSGDGFDLIPSNVLVGTLEQELTDEIGRELKLTEAMARIREPYDVVLIDCPPSLGFLTINAIRAANEVIIPVETSRFSMQGVDHLMDIVSLIQDRLHHPVRHRILITMFDSRLRHSFSMLSQIREKFSEVLFDTIIHINVKLKESAVMGQTVIGFDKYCRGSKDYFSLAKEIIAVERSEKRGEESTVSVGGGTVEAPAVPHGTPQPERQPAAPRVEAAVREEAPSVTVPMTFTLQAPEARSVYVTGSFNDWSLEETCRMRLEDGVWKVRLDLRPGLHRYQFIVDGRWREDPANPRQERNSFGDINSLIEIPPMEAAVPVSTAS